jgi:hypothetical protein
MSMAEAARLWQSGEPSAWAAALEAYPAVVAAQGVKDLEALDRWYREELPRRIAGRSAPALEIEELVDVVRWKMKRGEWRARNLALVQSNPAEVVREVTAKAFDMLGPETDPTADGQVEGSGRRRSQIAGAALRRPLAVISELAGVGPATASAVLAAYRPDLYPFLDELVGAVVPALGAPQFTAPYYARYAQALQARAAELGPAWTAQAVGLALWAAAGGKAGT